MRTGGRPLVNSQGDQPQMLTSTSTGSAGRAPKPVSPALVLLHSAFMKMITLGGSTRYRLNSSRYGKIKSLSDCRRKRRWLQLASCSVRGSTRQQSRTFPTTGIPKSLPSSSTQCYLVTTMIHGCVSDECLSVSDDKKLM